MISSVLSTGDELEVNNAYANIGLIAGKVWAYDQEDPYRKLNQSLWSKYCKLSEAHDDNNERPKTVRDVIPLSRLAQYGNYEYNAEREKMYKSADEPRGSRTEKEETKMGYRRSKGDVDSSNEPWMIEQVEELFNRLTSSNQRLFKFSTTRDRSPGINGTESFKRNQRENCRERTTTSPRNVDDGAESRLMSRINDKTVRELWNSRSTFSRHSQRSRNADEKKMKNIRLCGEKRLDGRKLNSQSSCASRNDRGFVAGDENPCFEGNDSVRKQPVFPVLSAEVPEFFPKLATTGNDNRRGPIAFFPSSSERSYRDELFPYNRGQLSNSATISQNTGVPIAVSHPAVNTLIRGPHQWIQRLGPPIQIQVPSICSPVNQPIYTSVQPIYPTAMIHRPMSFNEKILTPVPRPIPAPIPVYQRPAELYQDPSQRRGKNNHGVDFNNLILLTKNAMKARRNQSKNPQQASSFILESRQPNLKSETDVLRWLEKGYPKRAREFATVNSLVEELNNFDKKFDSPDFETTTMNPDDGLRTGSATKEFDNSEYDVVDCSNVTVTKKRLYRDVLANADSTEIIVENVLDKRYDELEQQAMEQYRTSEECLALRYQELERQALEQYKNSSSSSESIRSIRSSTMFGRRDTDEVGNSAAGEGNELTKQGSGRLGFENRCGGVSAVENVSSGSLRGNDFPLCDRSIELVDRNSIKVIRKIREDSLVAVIFIPHSVCYILLSSKSSQSPKSLIM